jgi:hypothetical protein
MFFSRFSPPSVAASQISFAPVISTSIVVRPERMTPLRKIGLAGVAGSVVATRPMGSCVRFSVG